MGSIDAGAQRSLGTQGDGAASPLNRGHSYFSGRIRPVPGKRDFRAQRHNRRNRAVSGKPATLETECVCKIAPLAGLSHVRQEISARAWLGVAITALSRRPFPLFVTHLIRIRQCSSRAFNFADNTGDRLLDHVCNGGFDRRFRRWG